MGQDLLVDRLINTGNSFEGTSLPPKPTQGKRVPVVYGFKVLRNEGVYGGGRLTLQWFQEGISENNNFEIVAFNDHSPTQSTQQNFKDSYKNVVNTSTIIGQFKVSESPATVTIPATTILPVTLGITTRHSSGMLGEYEFLGFTTAILTPVEWKFVNLVAGVTTRVEVQDFHSFYICNVTSGSATIQLPTSSSVIEGFEIKIQRTDASANTLTLSAATGDTVNGFASVAVGTTSNATVYNNRKAGNWIAI